jgi:hypothetical protein
MPKRPATMLELRESLPGAGFGRGGGDRGGRGGHRSDGQAHRAQPRSEDGPRQVRYDGAGTPGGYIMVCVRH